MCSSCPPKSTSLVVCNSSARPAPEVAVNSGRGRSSEALRAPRCKRSLPNLAKNRWPRCCWVLKGTHLQALSLGNYKCVALCGLSQPFGLWRQRECRAEGVRCGELPAPRARGSGKVQLHRYILPLRSPWGIDLEIHGVSVQDRLWCRFGDPLAGGRWGKLRVVLMGSSSTAGGGQPSQQCSRSKSCGNARCYPRWLVFSLPQGVFILFQEMKQQMLRALREFAFGNANSPLVTKGTGIWALFWQQKLERPKEKGNKPKHKQTFVTLNSNVMILVFSRAA